jgi:hypothetical protein
MRFQGMRGKYERRWSGLLALLPRRPCRRAFFVHEGRSQPGSERSGWGASSPLPPAPGPPAQLLLRPPVRRAHLSLMVMERPLRMADASSAISWGREGPS